MKTEIKEKLLSSAREVYVQYAALEFAKNHKFTIEHENHQMESSLNDFITAQFNASLSDLPSSIDCKINGKQITISRRGESHSSSSIIIGYKGEISDLEVKKPNAYQPSEKLNLLLVVDLNYTVDKKGEQKIGTKIEIAGEKYQLGGPDKLDLYTSHMLTLHNLIKHIDGNTDIKSALVALATGSGKTFVQALWFLVSAKANVGAVLALPDKLVSQFKSDFKRLLPEKLVNKIQVLRKPDQLENPGENQAAVDALKAMVDGTVGYVVASYEHLLDHQFETLKAISKEHTTLCFDEVHLVMQWELRKRKLEALSEKQCILLTATPDKETYEICGEKPVAMMSSKQKAEEGHGDFSNVDTIVSSNIDDKRKNPDLKLGERIVRWIILKVSNAIEKGNASAATAALTKLQYKAFYRPDDHPMHVSKGVGALPHHALRWNLQIPLARKTLVLIDSNEELVDIDRMIRASNIEEQLETIISPYKDGNLRMRGTIYEFFQLGENLDKKIGMESLIKQKTSFDAELEQYKQIAGVQDFSLSIPPLSEQLDNNIYTNIVDYLLKDISGLSVNELNLARYENLKELTTRIKAALASKKEFYNQHGKLDEELIKSYFLEKLKFDVDTNPRGIDPKSAEGASNVLAKIACRFGQKIKEADNNQADVNVNNRVLRFVDNWSLDHDIRMQILVSEREKAAFNDFAKPRRVMYLMGGMEHGEIAIKRKVFHGFHHDRYRIYEPKTGLQKDSAKKRSHNSLETLNNNSKESRFTPQYEEEISESMADNMFKLGFVGMYVSNEKGVGFSDISLNNVVNIVPETENSFNNPAKKIQAIGRNRGLDVTQTPYYLEVIGRGEHSIFDVNHLATSDNYFPYYFRSETQYNKVFIKSLGKKVAAEIIRWIMNNQDPAGDVDPYELKQETHRMIAKALREINNRYRHKIQLSRRELKKVIKIASAEIEEQKKKIEKPHKLPRIVKYIGSLLYLNAKLFYYLKYRRMQAEFKRAVAAAKQYEGNDETAIANKAYGKIITNTSITQLISNAFIAVEYKNLFNKEANAIESILQKNQEKYLKNESHNELNQQITDNLLPFFVKFYNPNVQNKILEAAKQYNNWPKILLMHQEKLRKLAILLDKKDAGDLSNLLVNAPELGELADSLFGNVEAIKPYIDQCNQRNYISELYSIQQSFIAEMARIKMIADDHHVLYGSYKAFFQGKFLSEIVKFMPVNAYEMFDKILNEDNNAEKFSEDFIQKVITEGNIDTDVDFAFNYFINFFKPNYLELDNISSMGKIKNRAEQAIIIIQEDILRIQQRYVPTVSELVAAEPSKNRGGLVANLWSGVKNGAKGAYALIQYTINKKRLIEALSIYFQSKLLDNLKDALPKIQFEILSSVLGNAENANLFATYLVEHAREFESPELNAEFIYKQLKICFKDSEASILLEQLKSPSEISTIADNSVQNLSETVRNINEQYASEKESLVKTSLVEFFSSKERFVGKLNELFTTDSQEILIALFAGDRKVHNSEIFATYLMENQPVINSDAELKIELINCFEKEHPQIKDLKLISKGAEAGFEFIDDFQEKAIQHIDIGSVNDVVQERILQIIKQPSFYKIINDAIGYFEEAELKQILSILGNHNPREMAKNITQFIDHLRKKNYKELADEFLRLDDNADELNSENTKFSTIMQAISDLNVEIIESQCYFNSMNKKGDILDDLSKHQSKLVKYLEGKNIENTLNLFRASISDGDRDMHEIARNIFFLQGIRNALPEASKVNALGNRHQIKNLNLAKDKILKPIQERCNRKRIIYAIKKAWTQLASSIKNTGRAIAEFFSGTTAPTTPMQVIENKLEQESKEFGKKIHILRELTIQSAEQAQKEEESDLEEKQEDACKPKAALKDTITRLFWHINSNASKNDTPVPSRKNRPK